MTRPSLFAIADQLLKDNGMAFVEVEDVGTTPRGKLPPTGG
ncbi:hypothetical protein [Microvirga sp. VF16]|nr:hypothetical protein [Microvirga sp. VF16]